ncbi:MAG: serine/threonine protein kinase, partial [Phototrophicales bacterium]
MENIEKQTIRGYELHELLAQGGMGEVYRATQTVVGREVVIKKILPKYANQPEFIRRFEAEAKLVAQLDHLHIAPLYDYWRDPTGAYLVMRYLRGGTLRDSVRESGPWSPRAAVRLLNQIGAALTVAHRRNVVHRDIKPANILLDDDQNAYLT